MEIYRSAGVATIAALMAAGRTDETAAPAAAHDDFSFISRRCERAVVSAYRDLRGDGADDQYALQACAKLYRVLHPEASPGHARRLVAAWIESRFANVDACGIGATVIELQ